MRKRPLLTSGVLITIVLSAFALSAAASRGDSPPPGVTARCNDGTFSYSQTHSGTCSHHGGVAEWLTPSSSSTTTSAAAPVAAAPSTSTASSTSSTFNPPNVGHAVLFASRTKTSGCTLRAKPDRRCSPGAYYSGLTKTVICAAGFSTSTIRNVPTSEKHQVEAEYGMTPGSFGSTLEIDHIVSLELGGSNDIANLFPEKATFTAHQPGFHVKDKLENAVHAWVCQGKISLRAAQTKIATDWEALYKLVFGVAPS